MKKIVSLLLAVCMYLSVGILLTACDEEHTHTYKTEWSKDRTHHWHACETNGCLEILDKAEHTWNDGEVTTQATAQANGEKTFTCTVCGGTNVETVTFEDVWNLTLEMENFDNVTFRLYGEWADGEDFDELIKLDGDTGYNGVEITTDPEIVASIKNVFVGTVLGVLDNYNNFTYDSTTNVYNSNTQIIYTVNVTGTDAIITVNNVVVTIDTNNKLATMSCDMKQEFDGIEFNLIVTFEFSNYGTTIIE